MYEVFFKWSTLNKANILAVGSKFLDVGKMQSHYLG